MDFSTPSPDACQTRPLCHCLGIHAEEVRAVIAEEECTTVRSVTQSCGAGGGCTACHRHIKRMLHEHALAQRMTAELAAAPQLEFA